MACRPMSTGRSQTTIAAFQRRFVPQAITGEADPETGRRIAAVHAAIHAPRALTIRHAHLAQVTDPRSPLSLTSVEEGA